MSPVGFLLLASSASLMVQVVHTKEQCAFFSNQTTLFPGGDGHTVTLMFSVVNRCKDNNSTMKFVKVAKPKGGFSLDIICNIQFSDPFWFETAGCAYSNSSQTFTVTRTIDNYGNETLILVGELQNGYKFNKTVSIQMGKSTQVSFILVVSVSVGVIVAITFVTLITVCCVRSSNNITVETRPRMDSYAKPDQRSSQRQATAITNEVYRGSNVSLMIENDIYDGTAFQLT